MNGRSARRTGILAWLAGAALAAGGAVAAGTAPPAQGGADRVLAPVAGGSWPGQLLAVRSSAKDRHHGDSRSRQGHASEATEQPARGRARRGEQDRHASASDRERARRDTGGRTASRGQNQGRHRDEAADPGTAHRDRHRSGRRDRDDRRETPPVEEPPIPRETRRSRQHRDTNQAASGGATTASSPPERPQPLDEGDGFQPPAGLAGAARGATEAPLVPDYLPAPAASQAVAADDFERAFPGLSGLEPCDAVERLRATLKLRGIVVASAEPDRVRPGSGWLAAADGSMGLQRLVRHRDTNTARQGRSSLRERAAPRAAGRGRDREKSSRRERDDHADRRRGRDTGRVRGGRGGNSSAREERHSRQDDRRDDRRPTAEPAPRYVPPALSSHAYRIPSDALIARIRELQPACDDQRIAERAGRVETPANPAPASAPALAPVPSSDVPVARRPEPSATPTPATGDDDAPGAVYQSGVASWYGRLFHGRRTASGERYDMFKYTAAHLRLPLGTFVRIWRRDHRKSVVVKVNDRGPYHSGRILDLSYAAAQVLGLTGAGSGPIEIELLDRRTGGTTLAREEAVFTTRRLEAGAFTDPADAEVRRQTLADAGFADAVVVPVPGVGLYAVRVGPYASAGALEAARARIERLGLIVDAVPD